MARAKKTNQQLESEDAREGDTERLSAVTENYLLCLYKLWEDSVAPSVTALSDTIKELPSTEGLGSSVPSVAGMTRRMQKQGLVDIGPDKRIRLTAKGFAGGEDIVRRHRLAECLVVELLGMDLHRAHVEAHRLEHGISADLEAKLMERLGFPKKAPYGRPIPGSGQPMNSPDAVTLAEAKLGDTYLVDRVPEEDSKLIKFLDDAKIIPEREVRVVEATPYLGVLMVATASDQVSMGYNVAEQIMVRPVTVGQTA